MKISDLGTILGLWAHPDDEAFSSAGLMHRALKNDQKVVCITATRGEAGVQNEDLWPAEKLADIRSLELKASLAEIGPIEHYFLGYSDGQCANINDELALEKILEIAERVAPDTLVTFEPNGVTGHSDHKTVSRWADLLASRLPNKPLVLQSVVESTYYEKYGKELDKKFDIYFATDKPICIAKSDADLYIKLNTEEIGAKRRALKAQISQTNKLFEKLSDPEIEKNICEECFVLSGKVKLLGS